MPRPADPAPPGRLSLGPASKVLGIHPDTLRRWADEGRIETFLSLGGHRRFDRRELERVSQLAPARIGPAPVEPRVRPRTACRAPTAGATSPSRQRGAPGARSRPVTTRRSGPTAAASSRRSSPTWTRPNRATASAAESTAAALTDDLARRLAAGGISLTESVGLFVAARRPFLSELGVIARRRALDAERISAMFEEASALLDRLLVRLIAVHQEAT